MKTHTLLLVTIGLVCAPLVALSDGSPPLESGSATALGFSESGLAQITRSMKEHITTKDVAALSTVITKNGKVVYFSALGHQDLTSQTALRRDTIFRVYSMTKPITAVAAMLLYEEGKFQLFDPVSKYIPAFAKTRVYVGGGAKNPTLKKPSREITIHDLFRHTACLSYPFSDHPVDQLYGAAELFNGRRSSEEFADAVARLPLRCEPGSRWTYGVATDILGRIVEIISGQSLADFMKRRIFDPLGMADTGFYVPAEKLDRLASVYQRKSEGGFQDAPRHFVTAFTQPPKMAMGGGGLVSTVDDFLKFTQMVLNRGEFRGKRLLAPKTVDFMLQDHTNDAQKVAPGYGMGLGFGLLVDPVESGRRGNPGEAGWSGIANTYFWIDPKTNMTFMAWTQLIPWGAPKFRHQIPTLVYASLLE